MHINRYACMNAKTHRGLLFMYACLLGGDDVFYGYPGQDVVMNITATVLLAFGMSMDAFAASIGKGATLHKPKFSEALRTGLIFWCRRNPDAADRLGNGHVSQPVCP
ncbi:inner membrane protein [Escherichia coli]|nr:inner membrane protein [Escherichia coli]